MILKEKLQEALNNQLNAESFSAYLYLSMSAYFKAMNLDGFANWMYVQGQEEVTHAKKIYDFILRRGGLVKLGQIEAPKNHWESHIDAFSDAYDHEQLISSKINDLMELAVIEKDHATQIFLQWFVTEQVEEEENVGGIFNQLKLLEGSKDGLILMDRELGQRKFIPTAPVTGE